MEGSTAARKQTWCWRNSLRVLHLDWQAAGRDREPLGLTWPSVTQKPPTPHPLYSLVSLNIHRAGIFTPIYLMSSFVSIVVSRVAVTAQQAAGYRQHKSSSILPLRLVFQKECPWWNLCKTSLTFIAYDSFQRSFVSPWLVGASLQLPLLCHAYFLPMSLSLCSHVSSYKNASHIA